MRVLVADETGLLKSIELEKNEQRILSSRAQPQARARSIQRLCWYGDEREATNFQRNVVVARADGVVASYEASHGKILSAAREPDWSWPAQDTDQTKSRCVGLDVIKKFGSVVQCSDAGNVLVRSTLEDAGKPKTFNAGGDLDAMRLEPVSQAVIGVGGKEHDLNLWSLETQQMLFRAKNITHDKLDMRVPVWVKDLRFLSTPGNSNGHRVVVGTGHRHVRIYDTNTKRRPVQQLDNFGENPIQSLSVSPDETRIYVGDTAGNLDILDLRTLKHMGRCTGPVGSIRDIACHPTLPYVAAVGLDRMVHVFDINTRKYRHTVYAKQRLNSVLFCADGLKDIPIEVDEPAQKKQKSKDTEKEFDFDDEEDEEEEAYEGLEISEEEEEDLDDDEDDDEDLEEDDERVKRPTALRTRGSMLSRFGFGQEATTASGSDAELAVFMEKVAQEPDEKKRKKAFKQKKREDDELPKLFMELKWSEQRKMGAKAPVLRQVEGDSINQRIRLYRSTIFFHIHAKLEHNGYIAQRLRLNNQNPNGKDEKGRTALHYACRHGANGAVRTLIHEETTIDDPDLEMRWTPLHYAVMGGHESIVKRLVDKAPVRRITINRKDKCGMTSLMLACGEDHAGVAKLLLRKKAFIDETDNDGWTALHYAAANDATLAAEVLVQYDINLKSRTESTNETALEMAERLRSHLVAILLYEVTYRRPQQAT